MATSLGTGSWRAGRGEALIELFNGPEGACRLGHLLSGADAGRIATLRHVRSRDSAAVTAAVEAARSIAHPDLLKVLGCVEVCGELHVASEYIAGASLFELCEAARIRGIGVAPAVAVHIVERALRATATAQRLLSDADRAPERCIYMDTIWIAEFGDAFLTEPGIAVLLDPDAASPQSRPNRAGADPNPDVFAAAVLLFESIASRSFVRAAADIPEVWLPPALANVVARALCTDGGAGFDGPEAMADALAGLPEGSIASKHDVGNAMQRLLKPSLELRRAKLSMFELARADQEPDDATRSFNADDVLRGCEVDTVRPPAPDAAAVRSEAAAAAPGVARVPSVRRVSHVTSTPRASSSPCESSGIRRTPATVPAPPSRAPESDPRREGTHLKRVLLPPLLHEEEDDLTQLFIPIFAPDAETPEKPPSPPCTAEKSELHVVYLTQQAYVASLRRPEAGGRQMRAKAGAVIPTVLVEEAPLPTKARAHASRWWLAAALLGCVTALTLAAWLWHPTLFN